MRFRSAPVPRCRRGPTAWALSWRPPAAVRVGLRRGQSALPAMLLKRHSPGWVRSLVWAPLRPFRASRRPPVRHAGGDSSQVPRRLPGHRRYRCGGRPPGIKLGERRRQTVVGPRRAVGRRTATQGDPGPLLTHRPSARARASRRPPSSYTPAWRPPCRRQHAYVAEHIERASLGSTGTTTCGSPVTPTGYSTRSNRSSPEAGAPPPTNRVPCPTRLVHRRRRIHRARNGGGDQAWATVLDAHDRIVERHVASARIRRSSPATERWRRSTGPARAIECACAIRDAVKTSAWYPRRPAHRRGRGDRRRRPASRYTSAARIMGLARVKSSCPGAIPALVLGSESNSTTGQPPPQGNAPFINRHSRCATTSLRADRWRL